MDVLDTMLVGLYRRLRSAETPILAATQVAPSSRQGFSDDQVARLTDGTIQRLDLTTREDPTRCRKPGGPAPPIIVTTSNHEMNIRDRAQENGCAAFFWKPVDGRVLTAMIASLANR
jgi:CheY-like chemotaxis protein